MQDEGKYQAVVRETKRTRTLRPAGHDPAGDLEVEFVQAAEVKGLLKDHGIVEVQESDECSHLRMEGGESVVHLHLHSAANKPVVDQGMES